LFLQFNNEDAVKPVLTKILCSSAQLCNMLTECFEGTQLQKEIDDATPGLSTVLDQLDDDSDDEAEYEVEDTRVTSIRRFHLQGAAAKVTPITDLNEYLHQSLMANLTFSHRRVPLLVQHLTPLCLADYDTLLLAPPGPSQIEAIVIPIINQILVSFVDNPRQMSLRPRAVIICSHKQMRKQINWVVGTLTTDLPISTCCVNSKDKLNLWLEKTEDKRIDILITAPAAYIAFTRRRRKDDNRGLPDLFIDRLQYFVVFEVEEVLNSIKDYSKIIENLRREKDLVLILHSHTAYVNRKNDKRNYDFDYAEKRSNLENLLRDDCGVIIIDPSIAVHNFVVMDDSEVRKLQFLNQIISTHKGRYSRNGKADQFYFTRRILIVVSNEDRARFLFNYLTRNGRYHSAIMEPQHLLHMERESDRSRGPREDPYRRIKARKVMGVITSDVHRLRLTSAINDKVVFYDLIPNMESLVMNCSKIVGNRYNFFFLNQRDLIDRKRDVRSLVQYLKDTDTEIPKVLKEFESIPHSVKSIY
ncbi:hypothetical protein PFISCL1PPCAC_2041, partial [Pristionchus fissidentatus]